MKKVKYTIATLILSFVFWFFDASMHYFVYGEPAFEYIPGEFDEFWMRTLIVLLIMLFGVYADFSTEKLLSKEKQLEAIRIHSSMTSASQHILNNLLNQMQIIRIEALSSNDFDKELIKLYDVAIDEAQSLIQRLSRVEKITGDNIWASVDPQNLSKPDNRNN